MEDIMDNYNLGMIEEVTEETIVIKPMVVIDGTGYEKFEVKLKEFDLKFYSDIIAEEGAVMLPYDKNKNLIEIDEH